MAMPTRCQVRDWPASPWSVAMYDSRAVANFFLEAGRREGIRISPMKLQKLVYIAHGFHLAIFDQPLVDQAFEAWPYGPVEPTLFHEFKSFGRLPITRLASVVSGEHLNAPVTPNLDDYDNANKENTKALLRQVWNGYKGLSGTRLSELTHQPGTPWTKSREGMKGGVALSPRIQNKLIRDYYCGKLSKAQSGLRPQAN